MYSLQRSSATVADGSGDKDVGRNKHWEPSVRAAESVPPVEEGISMDVSNG